VGLTRGAVGTPHGLVADEIRGDVWTTLRKHVHGRAKGILKVVLYEDPASRRGFELADAYVDQGDERRVDVRAAVREDLGLPALGWLDE